MAEPSMKGTVFANVLDELQRFVAAGKITREMLAERLAPEDLAIVERPVHPSAWYRISLYAQLMQLMDEVADGTSDFARQRGERSAEQLLKTGIYQQLEYLQRASSRDEAFLQSPPEERFALFGRDLRLITSLAGSVYNHSSWTVKLDPDHANRWMIEIAEAGAFPDTFLRGNEGFINRICAELGFEDLWQGERPQGDLIRYRMTHSPF